MKGFIQFLFYALSSKPCPCCASDAVEQGNCPVCGGEGVVPFNHSVSSEVL